MLCPVWVIQTKSTGHFLGPDLFLVSSLKDAGFCEDEESALDTARCSLDEDFELHRFYLPEEVVNARSERG